ncbi:gliding motility-associated peptidyl-prolyl isomerase GldI [Flavobacterium franklandianum]|uniref:Peptidyl-prolyl cis-trans isomerase n=1 Tax=Flavobacterium franklandianum TaxID=2594430 RepID=A0A553C6F4_9FLAO|nr:gliding motility-associated peptidyl-prolyl isomerase GldI [Flavobacterium franklandianum]TRX15992.1 gliding motility-associated peptidyl-prolyl isomerase GldI [Flavobacterium franklandianum]
MNNSKIILLAFLVTLLVSGCKQNQEARRPVSQASGTFMKKSAERNKKLVSTEEDQIDSVIKRNPKVKFIASTNGYWYTYVVQNTLDTLTPKKGDVAFFNYEIKDLKGKIIYSELELRPQTYAIDKQNIMTGLREGIKLMRKKEKVIFLFPSHIAYGYHGDEKKIGPNQPLLCTVTLHNFISEAAFKKEILLRKTDALNQVPGEEPTIQTKIINTNKDTLTNKHSQ